MAYEMTKEMGEARELLRQGLVGVKRVEDTDRAIAEFTEESKDAVLEVLGLKDIQKQWHQGVNQLVGVMTLANGDAAMAAEGEAAKANHYRTDIKVGQDTYTAELWRERERYNPAKKETEVAKNVMGNSITSSAQRGTRYNAKARAEVAGMLAAE